MWTRFKAAVARRDIADWYGFWFTADFTLFQPTTSAGCARHAVRD